VKNQRFYKYYNGEIQMKMTKWFWLFGLVLLLVLSIGCGVKFTKRYHTISVTPVRENCKLARISTFAMDVPHTSKTSSLMRLSAQGQAALIRELGMDETKSESLLKLLGSNFGSKTQSTDIIDKTTFNKRVVFSVEKQAFDTPTMKIGLADRIERLAVKFSGLKGAEFKSWDKFETQYETVDLGNISNTRSTSSSFTYLAGSTEVITPGIDNSLTEEVSLKRRYVVLGGHLEKTSAHLYQQGATGIDLAGNFNVDFVIKAESDAKKMQSVVTFNNLWSGADANKGDNVTSSFKQMKYAKSSEPISCSLDFYYSLRHVLKYAETISEADDEVELIRCHDASNQVMELVGRHELTVKVYSISIHKKAKEDKQSKERHLLRLKGGGNEVKDICFQNHDGAESFLRWLKASKSLTVGRYSLQVTANPIRPLTTDDIPSMFILEKELN
jgi:hypothetical protein